MSFHQVQKVKSPLAKSKFSNSKYQGLKSCKIVYHFMCKAQMVRHFNPLFHNVEKWPNIL